MAQIIFIIAALIAGGCIFHFHRKRRSDDNWDNPSRSWPLRFSVILTLFCLANAFWVNRLSAEHWVSIAGWVVVACLLTLSITSLIAILVAENDMLENIIYLGLWGLVSAFAVVGGVSVYVDAHKVNQPNLVSSPLKTLTCAKFVRQKYQGGVIAVCLVYKLEG